MKRRSFLGMLAAAPVAAAVPALLAPAPIPPDLVADILLDLHTTGQALQRVTYDTASGRVFCERLNHETFRQALEPGLTKMFDEAYGASAAEWAELFK